MSFSFREAFTRAASVPWWLLMKEWELRREALGEGLHAWVCETTEGTRSGVLFVLILAVLVIKTRGA